MDRLLLKNLIHGSDLEELLSVRLRIPQVQLKLASLPKIGKHAVKRSPCRSCKNDGGAIDTFATPYFLSKSRKVR